MPWLGILRERHRRGDLVRAWHDHAFEVHLGQRGERRGVEVGDAARFESDAAGRAVGAAHNELVVEEVELGVKAADAAVHEVGSQPAGAHLVSDIPPVIDQRGRPSWIFPTICNHMCKVSRVSVQLSTAKAGQDAFFVIADPFVQEVRRARALPSSRRARRAARRAVLRPSRTSELTDPTTAEVETRAGAGAAGASLRAQPQLPSMVTS